MPNKPVQGEAKAADREIFLSDLLNVAVMVKGKKVGSLADLVIVETAKIPEVRSIFVRRPFGNPGLVIPYDKITEISCHRIMADIPEIKPYEAQPAEDAILLRDYVLDKKVLDLEENEVEVVYDIRLVQRNKKLYVTDVDTGRIARLRRLGLKPLARLLYSSTDEREDPLISWTYIQPLPTNIGSFAGNVKLNVLKEKLADMHPVDLADIIEELDHEQRVMVFSSLDTEHASDTLEEIEPNVQRDIIASLTKEKVVQLLNEMTPGQAADILSVLPSTDARIIIAALNQDNARKIQSIIGKQEERVINLTTQKILKFLPDTIVERVQNDFPRYARDKDVIMYIYIVDEQETLLGVIDLKELLKADDRMHLRDIMVENVISLSTTSTLKEASQQFARYDFRALPVTDDEHRLVGVIPYRDVMNLTHHFLE
ncbi:MAG: CBS domain-containing protein [Methanoregula sp.]